MIDLLFGFSLGFLLTQLLNNRINNLNDKLKSFNIKIDSFSLGLNSYRNSLSLAFENLILLRDLFLNRSNNLGCIRASNHGHQLASLFISSAINLNKQRQ